uniref:phosphoribosylaminoimidazole carboxylase n=1 Tax=Amorphochlora amoebiformis TaxID=1561963 RepID=A0A6T6WKJ0_9EUKA
MAEAAHRVGLKLEVLDPKGAKSPAGQIGMPVVVGSFKTEEGVKALGQRVKTLTMDLEHVNGAALRELESKGWSIQPSAQTLTIIQDKYAQKVFFRDECGVPTADFTVIDSLEDLKAAGAKFGFPLMLKCRSGAYDGRGNIPIKDTKELTDAWESMKKLGKGALYAEKWVPYTKELAVMVVRGAKDQIDAYPVVETVQKDSICHLVLAPAQISEMEKLRARTQAMKCVSKLHGRGIFGIELFITKDGEVLLNEIAPRPHNSGHYTQDACVVDQFENHLRAVAGLPLGSCAMAVPYAVMLNILGDETGTMKGTFQPLENALKVPEVGIHYYGKDGVRKGRKLAHVNIVAKTLTEVLARADAVIPKISSAFRAKGLEEAKEKKKPLVGIVMGSDSDLPTMEAAALYLEKFDVPYELTIVSAHRTPRRLFNYATTAVSRGIEVIIAGAGGAAHLPGMVAALTPLPVIGVPVKTSTLSGNDSLLSIVQMPRGVPVATVAIGNSTNAGLLAVRILGVRDRSLLFKMDQFMQKQEEGVNDKIDKMEQMGWAPYLAAMPKKKH